MCHNCALEHFWITLCPPFLLNMIVPCFKPLCLWYKLSLPADLTSNDFNPLFQVGLHSDHFYSSVWLSELIIFVIRSTVKRPWLLSIGGYGIAVCLPTGLTRSSENQIGIIGHRNAQRGECAWLQRACGACRKVKLKSTKIIPFSWIQA